MDVKTIGPFALLIKPVSARCNLRCKYCFYYGRTSDPYFSELSPKMDYETLSSLVQQYMELSFEDAVFCWQGGEPLLAGIDFFKMVTQLQNKYSRQGQSFTNTIQTNGVLINKRWANFFKENNFLVGISLDGPAELHNHYRLFPSGEGSYKEVIKGIRLLQNLQVNFNILTVVNKANVGQAERIYDFFLSQRFHYLQFIPCVEVDPKTRNIASFAITPQEYADFLCRLFNRWFNGGSPEVSITLFENILMAYLGLAPEICIFRNQCQGYLVIEYNGDVYPCDFFVERNWRLGNLLEIPLRKIARSKKRYQFAEKKELVSQKCQNCRWNFICRNGCPRRRYIQRENFYDVDYFCEAYQKFFIYSEARFKLLAKKYQYHLLQGA